MKTLYQELIPVQPLNKPCGKLFYIDYNYLLEERKKKIGKIKERISKKINIVTNNIGNNTQLTNIPSYLFSSSGITSMYGLFSNCTSLTTIQSNLFSSGGTSSFGDNLLNNRKIKINKITNNIKNKKYNFENKNNRKFR